MPATLSPESAVMKGLRELTCSARNFVQIARILGTDISDAGFSRAKNDTKAFDRETASKLTEILSRMFELQQAIYSATDSNGSRIGFVEIDWSRTQKITDALTLRLTDAIAKEVGVDNPELQEAAEQATRQARPPIAVNVHVFKSAEAVAAEEEIRRELKLADQDGAV